MNKKINPKVAIIIPAYNESQTIGKVIETVSKYGMPIVINDGSTDETELIAMSKRALVVSMKTNKGYDNAIAVGISKAIGKQFDYAITFDADGQHDSLKITEFVRELENGADIVVGARDNLQRPAEYFFARLANKYWGILDPLCGMKGYRLEKIKRFKKLCTYQSIGTELTIRAKRSGWVIREIAVRTNKREDKSRFGSGFKANLKIIKAILLGILATRGISKTQEISSKNDR